MRASVAVVSNTCKPLMPTSPYRARHLLKKGRAKIFKYRPIFTIQIIDREDGQTQKIEYKSDTGYIHVGISVCSEKREFFREQRDLLSDEVEKHNDRLKYRRTRRNRKRYRKSRFNNRISKIRKTEKKGHIWLAPSLEHKADIQVQLFQKICEVMPITDAFFEMGKFDPALMKAIAEGKPAPQGTDYQMGERYQIATIRAAVFARDHHTCIFCGRGIKEKAILHAHHIGFWKHDRSNRLSNLATCCEKCHTSENHQPDGILYGKMPKVKNMASAAFMNAVRYELLKRLKKFAPEITFHTSYGAKTSIIRKNHNIDKSHTNDAYCLGNFFPKLRTEEIIFKKVRRNDRILQKFYDAKYIDARDGSVKKGKELTNGKINRNHKKGHENLHPCRRQKIKKGYITIRKSRTEIKPGTLVEFGNEIVTVHGLHRSKRKNKNGEIKINVSIEFKTPTKSGRKCALLNKCKIISQYFNTGWKQIIQKEVEQEKA